MRNLVKTLAVLALVVILGAVCHSVFSVKAQGPYGKISVLKPISGSAATDQDINVILRGFGQMTSDVSDNQPGGRLTLVHTCAAPENLDPIQGEPRLCGLFQDRRIPAFTALFAVGILNSTANPKPAEAAPPHLAGMQVTPGEPILVPDVGGKREVAPGYVAMVIYADSNSVALKYTNYDDFSDPGGSYTIHIIGFKVDQDLIDNYNLLNSQGRKFLPGVRAGQRIGVASGNQIWVSIRDTGSFMDARWRESWWQGCTNPNTLPPLTNDQVNNNPPPHTIQLANISTQTPIHTSQSGTDDCPVPSGSGSGTEQQKQIGTVFPPIHALQACPPEVPIFGTVQTTPTTTTPPPTTGFACDQIKPISEPTACQTASNAMDLPWLDPRAFCYPSSCSRMGGGGHCGLWIENFCNQGDIPRLWGPAHSLPCNSFSANQITDIGRCLAYYQATGNFPAGSSQSQNPSQSTNSQALPACIPTNINSRCITECSDPIQVQENYRLTPGPIANCLNTQDCVLKMKLDQSSFNIPFVKQLADYFGGYLDAGGVAAGTITQQQLDDIKNAIASGDVTEAFQAAGVARKLLPIEIQDQQKCQFITGVTTRINNKLKDPKNAPNTKYLFYTDDSHTTTDVFKIDSIPITQFQLPANCNSLTDTAWQQTASGKAWVDVPLFDNEDAQAEIQFVSPTLYSSNVTGGDPNYPNNPLGPIYISVPEIRRLSSASGVLQQALIPQQMIAQSTSPLLIGKPVVIAKTTDRAAAGQNTCQPIATGDKSWDPYYSQSQTNTYENNLTETVYNRGVLCQVPPVEGATDSQICAVGPDGQLFCYREDTPASAAEQRVGKVVSDTQTLQVRTVTPYLFDIAEQTISSVSGLLRIFKPEGFEASYAGLPAASDKVKYQLTGGYAQIDPNSQGAKDGWRIFLYQLGGLWNARNFVLQLLWPKTQ